MTRKSGILLHPTSLPGRWGIGDLGDAAYTFVDFLAATGQQLWQVMPLGPTGYGDSPYQGFSAFAGNPLLISLDRLLAQGLLASDDLAGAPQFSDQSVDYGAVIPFKQAALRRSFEHFKHAASQAQRDAFAAFRTEQRAWLADYALFAALKDAHGGASWNGWEPSIARREAPAVGEWGSRLSAETERHAYMQWLFFEQWRELKAYANVRGIQIIGDIPIFVAYDSADVWANRAIFELDDAGAPTVVAGVPPDYFSATGQLWGNPLYRWDVLKEAGYAWWIERFRTTLTLVDIARIDHFRGFAAYWEVPASESTAVNGRWVPAPGRQLFDAVRAALEMRPMRPKKIGAARWRPLVSFGGEEEDRTPDLRIANATLSQLSYPPTTARILANFAHPSSRMQRMTSRDPAWLDAQYNNRARVAEAPRILERWAQASALAREQSDCVLDVPYGDAPSETLDLFRTRAPQAPVFVFIHGGWWRALGDMDHHNVRVYLARDVNEHTVSWDFIRLALASVAEMAIVPMQDVFALGSEGRMNTPGQAGGNWTWRYKPEMLTVDLAERLRALAATYGRVKKPPKPAAEESNTGRPVEEAV